MLHSRFFMFLLLLQPHVNNANASCKVSPKWSIKFEMEDIFGLWFAVGFLQHAPNLTDQQDELGCIILYIAEETINENDSQDWLPLLYKTSQQNQKLWTGLYGTQHRESKRDVSTHERLRVIWDEGGRTFAQTYTYSNNSPTQWVVRHSEDVPWDEGFHPKRDEFIHILQATSSALVLHHCMDNGRPFTLVLRRTPAPLQRWNWLELRKIITNYQLPFVYRESVVCSACRNLDFSIIIVTVVLLFIELFGQY